METPSCPLPDPSRIPTYLRQRGQWVCWKYERRQGKPTKIPVDATTGRAASVTNSKTWATLEEALAACRRNPRLAGVGFVITSDDDVCGLDVDGCITAGEITDGARALINKFNSYAEISPSGRGVKIFFFGKKPAHVDCRSDEVDGCDHIELYDCGRYFAVTGNHVSGTPTSVENCQAELDEFCRALWPPPAPKSTRHDRDHSHPDMSAMVDGIDMAERERRCIRYLQKCPDAISGHAGHDATLRAACECFRFGLDDPAARSVMEWFNDQKTGGERWTSKELDHKLASARSKVDAAGEFAVRLVNLNLDSPTSDSATIAALRTDVGNAARLVRRFGKRIRYCYGLNKWLIWDGRRWKPDDRGQIVHLCKQTALGILSEAKKLDPDKQEALVTWALASQKRERLTAMAALAEPDVAVVANDLDADPWLFNCLNGTLNLKTGELQPHKQDDLITKLAPVTYDPQAACPRFDQFLLEIFGGEEDVIAFIARWHGYSLTADVREQYLLIYHGDGNNGKNVLLDTISEIMGEYAGEAPPDLLTIRKHPEHPTEIVDLMGKRLVIASETERDAELRLQFIKRATGNARLKGRRMREDYFEFPRTHKLILVTNNRPVVRENTEAVWRRLRVVRFGVVIPEAQRDSGLMAKLRAEHSGILTWLVKGCMDWHRLGLAPPSAVHQATGNYRETSDNIDGFIRQRCSLVPDAVSLTADLRASYAEWCAVNRRIPLATTAWGEALKSKGCYPKKIGGRWQWVGVRLDHEPDGHSGQSGHASPVDPPIGANSGINGKGTSTPSTPSRADKFPQRRTGAKHRNQWS